MPTLNKDDLDTLADDDKANLDTFSRTLPKPARNLTTGSLPRPGKPRMQTVLESQQLNLDLGDQEKPPLPPKPSPPHQFSKFIISPQPFRRTDDAKLTLFAGNTPHHSQIVGDLHHSQNTNIGDPSFDTNISPSHDSDWYVIKDWTIHRISNINNLHHQNILRKHSLCMVQSVFY